MCRYHFTFASLAYTVALLKLMVVFNTAVVSLSSRETSSVSSASWLWYSKLRPVRCQEAEPLAKKSCCLCIPGAQVHWYSPDLGSEKQMSSCLYFFIISVLFLILFNYFSSLEYLILFWSSSKYLISFNNNNRNSVVH